MAYTTAQLVTAYTNANLGKAPDAATTLTLDAYATQSQTGGISDATALANTLKLVNSTTAVAVQTYQFFTGAAPSAAGLEYLVDSDTNTTDLNDAYYAKFAQENRFINFSINLATGSGAGAASFAASYGSVSYAQTVATAYDKIIGNAAATAAGVDVAAAVAYLSRQANIDYLTAFVKANTGLTAAADIDLAVKAALIGTILNAATVSGIGGYAKSTTALINDLSDGTLSTDNAAGVNILTAYPTVIAVNSALTTGVDTVVGTSADDTISGTYAGGATDTLTVLDSIDGGAGTDTLKITATAALDFSTITGLAVKNVENVVVTTAGALTANTTGFTGATSFSGTAIGNAAVTSSSTTAVSVTQAATNASTVTVNGGSSVNVTSAATGLISVGVTTQQTGATTVTASKGAAVTVDGGTSVTVTETGNGAVTIGGGKAVSGAVSVTSTGTGAVAIDGGTTVTVASSGQGTGTINIGATTQATGAISVTNGGGYADADITLGNVTVKGGSTVTVSETAGFTTKMVSDAVKDTTNNTVTLSAVSVTGTTDTTSVSVSQAATVAKVDGVVAVAETGKVTESAAVTFGAVANADTLIFGGLTFTATSAMTAAQAATIFADLKAGATTGYATAFGTYTGTLAGYNTGSVATGNKVTFTSTTANTNVADLANTGTNANATVVVTQGAASTAVDAVEGILGVTNNTVSITDVNSASSTKAGTITTVTLANASAATIADNSLSTLNLSGDNGNVTITAAAGAISGGIAATTLTVNSAGTVGTLTGNQYKTLNVAASASTTFTGVTSSAATSIAVSGTGTVNLGTLTTAALTKVTASGSVNLTANVSGVATVTSVDTSASSGNATITIDATAASFTGGAGNDRVTIAASPTKAISAGAGTDTLVANIAGGFNASANANITGFETLGLGALSTGTFNATGFTALTMGAVGGAVTFSNVAAGVGLTITAAPTAATTVTLADATGTSDTFALTLSSSAALAANTVTVAGVESITINAVDTNSTAHVDTLTLVATSAKSLTVTGSAGLNLTNTGNTALATFDASASTGAITFATAVTTGTTTITGSATKANALTGGTAADTIVGGSAADTLASGTGLDILTGGAGNDTFVLSANVNGNTYATITDFAKGDVITVTALSQNAPANFALGSKVTLADTAAFADYLNAAASGDGSTNTIVKWFQYAGNTYIVFDNESQNTFQNGATADQVVKLTGLVDLSTAVSQVGGVQTISII